VANPASYGFLAPPTVLILLATIGAAAALFRWRAGAALALAASLGLFVLATPACSSWLLSRVEAGLPRDSDLAAAQAIVVLGGGVRAGNGRDIADRLSRLSLERVVFAAEAWHRLHRPVAVSGGAVRPGMASDAALMKAALERDFAVPVRWTEDRSQTTWENAVDTARLLRPDNVATVVLVSQAWHLPRALWSFERVGLKALPWPAPRSAPRLAEIDDFLPSAAALHDSFYALHELIGGLYYRLRH